MSMSEYQPMNDEDKKRTLKRIGASRGVVLLEAREGYIGKRYAARVWDKHTKKYDSRDLTFDTLDALVFEVAKRWSNFEHGAESAGAVTLKAVLPHFLKSLDGRSEGHIDDMQKVFEAAIKAGVNNLKDKLLVSKTTAFIEGYRPKSGFGCKQGPRAPRTIGKRIGYFKQLGRFCVDCDPALLQQNPFRSMKRPWKGADRLMPTLTVREARAIVTDEALDGGRRGEGLWWAWRLYTGMRTQEAAWARWPNIDTVAQRIVVRLEDDVDKAERARLTMDVSPAKAKRIRKRVKGNKERKARLMEEFSQIIEQYRPADGGGDRYIFPEAFRTRDSANDGARWRYHQTRCGINRPDVRPHDLRATNACLLMGAGLPEAMLVKHLGHGASAMTRHYAARADDYENECQGWNKQIRLRSFTAAPGATPEAPVQLRCNGIAEIGNFQACGKGGDQMDENEPIVIVDKDLQRKKPQFKTDPGDLRIGPDVRCAESAGLFPSCSKSYIGRELVADDCVKFG